MTETEHSITSGSNEEEKHFWKHPKI